MQIALQAGKARHPVQSEASLAAVTTDVTDLQMMEEIRCGACRRKLGEGEFTVLSIKCPRCGAMNVQRAARPASERQGASNPRGTPCGSNHSVDRRQTPPG